MNKPTEEFLARFSSLEGQTLKERYKNFRQLLQDSTQFITEEQKIEFSNVHPQNPLEEIFKVDAIIYFQDYPEIIRILKSENVMLIKRVLRSSPTLLVKIFEDITTKELMQLFPYFSYNTKLKILNKLNLKNTKKAELFFEAIRGKYGLYMASKVITCCSGQFIIKKLDSYKIEITCGQLLKIIKNNPNLTEEILNALKENYSNETKTFEEKYEKVFRYLMKSNFQLFLKLLEKYDKGKFCLGHRATKTFLTTQENTKAAVENSKKIYTHLKKTAIHKNLSQDDFEIFCTNIFPRSSGQFKEKFDDVLSVLHNSKHVDLLFKMYKTVYGCYLANEFLTVKLLEIMSPDEREALMENYSRPKEIYEEQWVSFMKTDKSLPMLKEKIALTSNIKGRSKIVPYLVLTCKFNNDSVGLRNVCEYIVKKHQNDHWRVRQAFLQTILSHYSLTKLEEDHWKCIYQLLLIGIANEQYYYGSRELLKGYIEFRLRKDLPIAEQLTQWVKRREGELKLENPKHYKQVLLSTYDLIGLCHDDSNLSYYYTDYLKSLSEWNKQHPEDPIDFRSYTKAIESFKSYLKESESVWQAEYIILQYIKLSTNEADKKELLDLYLSQKSVYYCDGHLLRWLLDNDPSFIFNNIETVTKLWIKAKRKTLWSLFKCYSHFGIPQKMSEVLKQILESNEDSSDVTVRALSQVLDASNFLKFIQTYLPVDSNVDFLSDAGRQTYKLHIGISLGLRNIFPTSSTIQTILKFCKGDYLNIIQKSLYLIAYNIAENNIHNLLDELCKGSVSVRKHPLHLGCKLLGKHDTYVMFDRFKDDKNSSIRKYLLKGSFSLFVNNPNEQAWQLLKESFQNVNTKDQEALDILVNWRKVPKAYYKEYAEFTWNILENISEDSIEAQERKGLLIDLIMCKDVMQMLPRTFVEEIIKKYFLQGDGRMYSKTNGLVVRYIIHSHGQVEEKLNLVFDILDDYNKRSQETYDLAILLNKKIFEFIEEFSTIALAEEVYLNSEILSKFIERFHKVFEQCKFLDEFLQLQFTFTCVTSKTLTEVSTGLQRLYTLLLGSIGILAAHRFCEIFKSFLPRLLLTKQEDEAERNRYVLIEEIRKKCSATDNNNILMIFLLPDDIPIPTEFKLKYQAAVEHLMKVQNASVQVYLATYLKSLNKNKLEI